ncbi:hypothetical protein I1E95_03390 [Synechococcus sp. CBW1107]|uniref:hypothetical protein n=1 Tax=Synechococcus sp. CBW1107 TaxID=2789857 RepID=UPI0018CFE0A3|nr:hypothetical protein [Synechococcus sp. CBW1107]QPN57204.1 hypothetical protein I1E95_03390 [Synechococcus sp. CBW1107]
MPLARGLSLVGLAAVLTTSLAACSGTPLGERLSGSFGTPATPAAAGTASGSSGAGPVGGPAAATSPSTSSPSTALPAPSPPAAAAPASGAAKPDGAVASRPVKPTAGSAAYRITIKLPGADPSAPAEAVTEALRAAGVSFEVETIERMPADGGRSAAAAGTSPAAPASSPAPAPR